jgi:pimeloyl-ACP methyl ester carboxylesterase
MSYDEFGLLAENAAEAGLDLPDPVAVRRDSAQVAPDRRISALVWGSVPADVVLLHGGGQNAHTWDTVLLALGRPAVAIDLPGHGHSDGPDPGQPAIEGYARDVATAIRALAPAARTVIGMSAGGLTAIRMAAREPGLISRLLLVDILPEPDPAAARAITDFLDGPAAFDSFEEILERTVRYNPTRSVSSLRRGILHNAVQREDGTWEWRHRRHRSALRSAAPGEAGELARALWEDLAGLSSPVLLVRGLAAGSVVTDEHVTRLREVLPAATIVGVPGAGHSVQGDRPVRLAEIIAGFSVTGLRAEPVEYLAQPLDAGPGIIQGGSRRTGEQLKVKRALVSRFQRGPEHVLDRYYSLADDIAGHREVSRDEIAHLNQPDQRAGVADARLQRAFCPYRVHVKADAQACLPGHPHRVGQGVEEVGMGKHRVGGLDEHPHAGLVRVLADGRIRLGQRRGGFLKREPAPRPGGGVDGGNPQLRGYVDGVEQRLHGAWPRFRLGQPEHGGVHEIADVDASVLDAGDIGLPVSVAAAKAGEADAGGPGPLPPGDLVAQGEGG